MAAAGGVELERDAAARDYLIARDACDGHLSGRRSVSQDDGVRAASGLGLASVLTLLVGVALVIVGAMAGAALADGEPIFNAGVAAIAAAGLLAVIGWLVAGRN